MDKISLITRMRTPVVRRCLTAVIIHVLLVLLFVSIVAFLREFKPEAAGFEQKGPALLLYHVSRLGLAFYITFLCFSVGYRTLELFQVSPQGLFNRARKTFILCFFLGASLYGITFTVLGLAGLINLGTGLALTIPVLLFSSRPIKALWSGFLEAAACQSFWDTHASPFFTRVVFLAAGGTALLFLLTRVVFIAPSDNNVWEHYFHYYRLVLASGSTQPNEVWHHFYACKGAGLIFLANVLSDFFGAQLVSACMVAVAGLIILDLLLEYCWSTTWAAFGVLLFSTYLYRDVSSGAMFQSHGVLLGYAGFALWGSVWLQRATAYQFRPLMVALVVSLTYLGFYMPVATAIFPAAFLLFTLANSVLHGRTRAYAFLTLACGLFAGSALAFVTNWILTGLLEVTPMRLFWAIADQVKVEEVFGTGGIEFFLARNNDLSTQYDWSFKPAWNVLRYPLPAAVVYLSLLGVLIVAFRNRAGGAVAKPDKFLAQLACFILPLSAFAQAVQSPSTDRMALYSVVFMTLASVVMLKRLVDTCVGFRLWHAASTVIIVCGMVLAIAQASKKVGNRWPIIYQYATGAMSTKDVLQAMESIGNPPPGMSIVAISDFRRTTDADDRVLSLAYDPGFSYTLPDGGIVSEPTYSLMRNPREMLVENPMKVADHLRAMEIKYFALNLTSRLFSTFAFTSLFDAREMSKYLSVAYEDGDFFILTFRQSGDGKPLPDRLLTLIELKRTGVLHYPFTERFAKLVTHSQDHVVESEDGTQLVDSVARFEKARGAFLEDLDEAFRSEVLPLIALQTSRTLLSGMLDAAKDEIKSTKLGKVLEVRQRKSVQVRVVPKVSERELKGRLLKLFRDAMYREYRFEVGDRLAGLSRNCDERFPFAINYPTAATCL